VIGVAAGGALGALARHGLSQWLTAFLPPSFPLPTLIINVLGSAVLGLVAGYGIERGRLPEAWRLPVTTGFIGAFTTFSTWSVETVLLLETGRWLLAAANVGLSLALGLSAVWAGYRVALRWRP